MKFETLTQLNCFILEDWKKALKLHKIRRRLGRVMTKIFFTDAVAYLLNRKSESQTRVQGNTKERHVTFVRRLLHFFRDISTFNKYFDTCL